MSRPCRGSDDGSGVGSGAGSGVVDGELELQGMLRMEVGDRDGEEGDVTLVFVVGHG